MAKGKKFDAAEKHFKEKVVPHLSIEGIKTLKQWFDDLNEQGNENIERRGYYR